MTISDIEQRLFDKLDVVGSKIDNLCDRMTRIETQLENHLEGQRRKFDKTVVVLGIVIGVVALAVAFKWKESFWIIQFIVKIV